MTTWSPLVTKIIYLLSAPTTEYRYQTENGEIFTVIVSVVLSLQLLLLLMNLFVFVMNPDVVLTGCLYLSTYSAGLQGMVTYVIGYSIIVLMQASKIISFALNLENDSAWDLEDPQVVSNYTV